MIELGKVRYVIEDIIGKKSKIAKFDSKIFGTPGNKSRRGKIGKIVKS